MEPVEYKKPRGLLGKLCDEVATYSPNPISEIERIAKQALSGGVITHREYTILQAEFPFLGYRRKTSEEIGNDFEPKLKKESVGKIRRRAYSKLQQHLTEREYSTKLDIKEDVTEIIVPMLTVYEVSDLLNAHPNTVRRLSNKGHLTTYIISTRGDRRYIIEDIEDLLNLERGSIKDLYIDQAITVSNSSMLTLKQVSVWLHVYPGIVRKYSNEGVLRACRIKPGGHRRFIKKDIDEFLESRRFPKSK